MFGSRLLVNMACRSVFKPSFKLTQSFASMAPVYIQTTTLLGKVNSLPTNLLIRNLRQMIMRAQQDCELDIDMNSVSQLSLLVQGNNLLIPSDIGGILQNRQDSQNNHAEYKQVKLTRNEPFG